MSDDIYAERIAAQIRAGKPPKAPRSRSKARAWVVLAICAVAASAALAVIAQLIFH